MTELYRIIIKNLNLTVEGEIIVDRLDPFNLSRIVQLTIQLKDGTITEFRNIPSANVKYEKIVPPFEFPTKLGSVLRFRKDSELGTTNPDNRYFLTAKGWVSSTIGECISINNFESCKKDLEVVKEQD